jgi:hypothetical protein
MEMDKKLEEGINWFLNFLNTEIEDLSKDEIVRLWTQLRERIYGTLWPLYMSDSELIQWSDRMRQAKSIQEVLRNTLEAILATSKKPKKVKIRPLYGPFDEIEKAYQEEGEQDTGRMGPAISSVTRSRFYKKPPSKWARDYIAFTFQPKIDVMADGDNTFFFISPRDKLLYEFISLLRRVPLSDIRRCQRPDCRKLYIKTTQREKNFCSNQCIWIVRSSERRKNIVPKRRGRPRKEG